MSKNVKTKMALIAFSAACVLLKSAPTKLCTVTTADIERIATDLRNARLGSRSCRAGKAVVVLDNLKLIITGPHLLQEAFSRSDDSDANQCQYREGAICIQGLTAPIWCEHSIFYQLLRQDEELPELTTHTNLTEAIALSEQLLTALAGKNQAHILACIAKICTYADPKRHSLTRFTNDDKERIFAALEDKNRNWVNRESGTTVIKLDQAELSLIAPSLNVEALCDREEDPDLTKYTGVTVIIRPETPHCLRLLLPDTFCHLLRKIDPSLNIKCYGSNLTESVEFYKELLDSLVGKSGEDVLALSTAWDYLNPTTSSEMAIVTVKDKDRIDEILVKSLAGSGRSQAGTDTIMLDGVQLKITGPHLVDSGLGNRITEYVGGSICVEVTKDRFVWWIGSNTFYQLLRGLDPRLTEVRTPTNLNESIELTECILKALVAKNRNDIIALVTAWDQSLIDQEPSQT